VEDIRSGGMGNVYIAEHKKWKESNKYEHFITISESHSGECL
jgi:hypothetical protein